MPSGTIKCIELNVNMLTVNMLNVVILYVMGPNIWQYNNTFKYYTYDDFTYNKNKWNITYVLSIYSNK